MKARLQTTLGKIVRSSLRRWIRPLTLGLARWAGQTVARWQVLRRNLAQSLRPQRWGSRRPQPTRGSSTAAAAARRPLLHLARLGRGPNSRSLGDRRRILGIPAAQAGFVLPTTALLLVVILLTVTALSLRTLNRTEQVAGDRQQKIIYNSATPAIDRARAKLEKLFTDDGRLRSGGIPSEALVWSMMLNDDKQVPKVASDPYTLPDETRIKLNGQDSNAWKYTADSNGDGIPDTDIAYSIIFQTPDPNPATRTIDFDYGTAAVKSRAKAQRTRTGPLLSGEKSDPKCDLQARLGSSAPLPYEGGWYQDPNKTSTMRKNFQVDAVALPRKDNITSGGIKTIATLELQQDKIAERGNKWGAWFRTDLEIFAGGRYFWNGAMHSEGSMFLAGGTTATTQMHLLLVSAQNSCIYSPESSELSVANAKEGKSFRGDFAASAIHGSRYNFSANATSIHYQSSTDPKSPPVFTGTEAVNNFRPPTDTTVAGLVDPLVTDPVRIFTEDFTSRPAGNGNQDTNFENQPYKKNGRTTFNSQPKPYLDDFYRADNRYGPRPSYGRNREQGLPSGSKVGDKITANLTLTRDTNPDLPDEVGADGYWERRANNEGMKIVVGQRLNLGGEGLNLPSYPNKPEDFQATRTNEILQWRSQRDLLAGVQSALVYHNGYKASAEPVGVIASVVHPGSPSSLRAALTVEKPPGGSFPVKTSQQSLFGSSFGNDTNEWAIDFFNGRGTNGWEFQFDRIGDLFKNNDVDLGNALNNLSTFAGDLKGAFPAKQEAGATHPYPQQVKWGDFSNLRRTINDSANSQADLSNRQTAASTLGMLAYNLSYLDALDYSDKTFQDKVLVPLAEALGRVADPYDPNLKEEDDCLWQSAVADPADTKNVKVIARNPGKLCKSVSKTKNAAVTPAQVEESLQREQEIAGPTLSLSSPIKDTSAAKDFGGRVDIYRIEPEKNNPTAGGQPFGVRIYAGGLTTSKQTDLNPNLASLDLQLATPIDAANKTIASPPFKSGKVTYNFRDGDPANVTTPGTPRTTRFEVPRVPPEAYVAALGKAPASGTPSQTAIEATEAQWWARLIALKEQVGRDRTFGFADHVGKTKADGAETGKLANYQYRLVYLRDEQGLYATDVERTNKATNPDLSKDLNRNGIIDVAGLTTDANATVSLIPEEDLNGNGKLDTGEDLNGNNKLDTDENFDDRAVAETPLSATGLQKYKSVSGNGTGEGKQQVDFNQDGTNDGPRDINEDTYISSPFKFWLGGRQFKFGGIYEFGCDMSAGQGNNYFGFGPPKNAKEELRLLRLATTLCPVEAKYPSLYYTFPRYEHVLEGEVTANVPVLGISADLKPAVTALTTSQLESTVKWETAPVFAKFDHTQPKSTKPEDEPWLDPFLTDAGVKSSIGSYRFKAFTPELIGKLAMLPASDSTGAGGWRLPRVAQAPAGNCANSAPLCMDMTLIATDTDPINPLSSPTQGQTFYRVGFRDSAMFDGRDRLVNRVMDVDLDMLRDSTYAPSNLGGQLWLTVGDAKTKRSGGIVYGFREDTIREDAIARPPSGTWSGYNVSNVAQRMKLGATGSQDPPVNATTGISPKPVDFYADPDRRAHGFRLHDGITVKRKGQSETDSTGLSFVTDNIVYVQGDFNLHRSGGSPIEEFSETINNAPQASYVNAFYNRTNLNTNFASPTKDDWRVVELLADAVSPLSDNACDGSMRDALMIERISTEGGTTGLYGCPNSGRVATSFTNQNLPTTAATTRQLEQWWHENRFDLTSPVAISRSGLPLTVNAQTNQINDRAPALFSLNNLEATTLRTNARTTTIQGRSNELNAVMVSGLGPSRPNQSNGGLHNFPPFNERLVNLNYVMRGSFLQLNFRTSSTGPYDAEVWESADGRNPTPSESITYYEAPNRLWGYDVGLQYSPAGPISSRFLTLGTTRSEFYNEPAADDPYICQLRQALGDTASGCS